MLLHYFLILGTLYLPTLAQQKKIVCYWNSDSNKHVDLPGYFRVSDIDPNICTHIIYWNVYFSGDALNPFFSSPNKTEEFFTLKEINRNIKLLIGVGGYQWGSSTPSDLTRTPTKQESLANAIKTFLNNHSGFDGVDFNWQWPGHSGYADDKSNFASFIVTLRGVLTPQKILSISVAPRNEDIEKSYNISAFINHVDFINLNSFDLRGYITDTSTAFHSPYRKDQSDSRVESLWNAVSIVSSWKTRFLPTEKLTLGIATYGRSFTLLDASEDSVDSPINGLGKASSFAPQTHSVRRNIIPYSEICYNLKQEVTSWRSLWSEAHYTPYATFDEDQWVGYDDELSVLAKIHLVIDNDFAGINYATLDLDDFSGYCNSKRFPLIRLGYDALINGIVDPNPISTTVTPRPGETTPSSTTPENTTPDQITPDITTTTTTEETTTTSSSTTSPTTTTSSDPTTTTSSTTSISTTTTTEIPNTETETETSSETTTETPTTETDAETSPETTTESSTSSSTSTPSTISKTTTTQSSTSKLPTPPITPGSSPTNKVSADVTTLSSTSSIEDLPTDTSSSHNDELTTIAQSTESSTETESSTSSFDFKTPPVTPTSSSTTSRSDSDEDNITDVTDDDNPEEETTTLEDQTPTEDDSNEETTDDDSLEGSSDESSEYFSSEDTTNTDYDIEETTNDDNDAKESTDGDGAPGFPTDDLTTINDESTDDSTQNIADTTTVSSPIPTEDLETTPESSSIITEESSTSTEKSTTSKKTTVPSNFICPEADGNFKNPVDCTTFFICSNWYPHLFYCQPGLYYDEVCDCCDYQSVVECNVN